MVKAEELLKIAKEHPGLPMITMVNSEVVTDDGYSGNHSAENTKNI